MVQSSSVCYNTCELARGCLKAKGLGMQVLGVKARETGRATGQQAFIKANCPEARITITLWNEGPEAYLPDTFGNQIIIERRIGNTASYTIRNADGQKMGSRRDELDAILDGLQINAANPITVMTQVSSTRILISFPSTLQCSELSLYYLHRHLL